MQTTINKETLAKELAFKLQEKYIRNPELRQRELMELLNSLRTDKDFTSTCEPFLDLHNFTTEIACLLTNPEISKKLTEYMQEHVGEMLQKMFWFFERMQDEDMYMLLLHYRLKHIHNDATEEDLNWIADLIKD